jgi:methionyl-tRNA synthetase
MDRLAIHEAIAAVWRIVDELNGYLTEQEPWAIAKDPARRGRLETVLATAAEGLRALAVLLSPVIPKATARLWTALGAEAALGGLLDQPIREAGRWGLLPAGARTAALPPLFPRIEPEALSA